MCWTQGMGRETVLDERRTNEIQEKNYGGFDGGSPGGGAGSLRRKRNARFRKRCFFRKWGTHLNFSCYSYSNSMDPITNVNSSWCFLRYGVGECLFRFDENVEVENALCDSYETEDYTTWVLHIREA